jgi:diaminohydroxyphosphoribosylaminopyrimidine deaminase/5-amino-6-(5-phosphoribosylamino)uracil reductase
LDQDGIDREMMMRAIRLAEKGLFTASPNPRVGCVIIKENEVIGEGWHEQAGEPHAEIKALNSLSSADMAKGATVYVSLEPCSHTGKTGPCAKALIEAGVSRVVCAMQDPAPHVSGSGIAGLKQAGIEVETGLLEEQARALNPGFIKRMETSLPYVRVKMAMSLDGKTALANGESKWITGEPARNDVHRWRARSDTILTGSGTVLVDDPLMTVRLMGDKKVKQPLRCVIDSQAKLKRNEKIFGDEANTKTIGTDAGADWQLAADEGGKVSLEAVLKKLAEEEINEVWVEAGSVLAGAFVKQNLFDELVIYMAPVILGDKARSLFELPALKNMKERKQLKLIDKRSFGEDQRFIFSRI